MPCRVPRGFDQEDICVVCVSGDLWATTGWYGVESPAQLVPCVGAGLYVVVSGDALSPFVGDGDSLLGPGGMGSL